VITGEFSPASIIKIQMRVTACFSNMNNSGIFAPMEYFKNLRQLLRLEREEDMRSYKSLTENTSAAERRSNGICWFPIAIRNTEIVRGDYINVELERPSNQDTGHQFRFGSPVALFSNHDPNTDRVEGTITFVGTNRMKVTLLTDALPDWCKQGKLGVDLLFDNNSYLEMESALKTAELQVSDSKPELSPIDVLTGNKKPTFNTKAQTYVNPRLNKQQQAAVDKIVAANELAIVHGPPGTGKTTTLIHAISALIKQRSQQVLVVAASNTAVDLLTDKLAELGLNVVRIGNPARVSEKTMSMTLDSKMTSHSNFKDIKTLKKQASELKNMAHKYKRNFGRAEQEQRKALFNEAHRIMKDVGNTEQYIIDQVLASADVITATLVGAGHHTIRNLEFKTLVIDEAGQALEPACWIPILRSQKVILAGDHCQLPPTIKSIEAAKLGLNTTLLEKCIHLHPEAVVLLQEQYRMNTSIMGYSSNVFYGDKLIANAAVANGLLFQGDAPLQFIDTAGCGFDEKSEGTSISNPGEAAFLLKHLSAYVREIKTRYSTGTFPSIGVISPYQQQVATLREFLSSYPDLAPHTQQIAINTIDSFQGQERDIMYIGLTRSNAERNIGFLADLRRMNVAMTRARKKLVVIGDGATLSRLPFYSGFMTYAEKLQAYHSAWEFVES
jgi:ATP-dependent RNA/DNA helicase IGHMBP2